MIICGIQMGHEPSVCVTENGKIIYYNEERKLAKRKNQKYIPYRCINEIQSIKIDKFFSTSYNFNDETLGCLESYLISKDLIKNYGELQCLYQPHHLSHLFKSYFDSGFQDTRVFVIDGRGSEWTLENNELGYEHCSVYHVNENGFKCIYKKIFTESKSYKINKELNAKTFCDEDTVFDVSNDLGIGNLYANMSDKFNFVNEEGKFMGYQSYGTTNENYYQMLEKQNHENYPINVDAAATVQKFFEDKYLEIVKRFEYKNMIFTGGATLNVVNNYKIKKHFNKSNIYFEPVCGDEGNSIGIAYGYAHLLKEKVIQNKSIYLGNKITIDETKLNNKEILKDVNLSDVNKLLTHGNVVGLIQGRAEAGPRALGNRSLLLDPTLKNCKDIMNNIKNREKFRPFACSILEENADEYFDLNCKSPTMMLAAQAKEKAKESIPNLIHVDNTCRIQTVNYEDNSILYKLLKNFKLPILMNTSLNLAGFAMVEKFEDVLFTIRNSNLKYVYFADYNKLLIKELYDK